MLYLHPYLVVLVVLGSSIAVGLFVDDFNMNWRTLFLQILLLQEEAKEGRADCNSIIGSTDHDVESFLSDNFLISP
jgi:hypothetical protein